MIKLITFTDENMTTSAFLCQSSALLHGAKAVQIYLPYFSSLYQSGIRGGGYWAWKPEIIYSAMMGMQEGEYLIYCDAGVEIVNNLRYIIDRMKEDIWLFGNMYDHLHWCKMDIIDKIYPSGKFGKQCQASVIFFRVNVFSRSFVREWLKWCQYENLIDDSLSIKPNHPEFRENRHDQAILTTLAYKWALPLHWWPAKYNNGAFVYDRGDYPDEGYPVLFHHHRRRNSEWP